jgi:predicted unusual protein kinase regulating ubiquinone biosynthesis (AarF/ABC1/UbiB family)
MADDLEELTGGLRRMWSTASLTSKLAAKAAKRTFFRGKPRDTADDDTAIESARKLVSRMGHLKGLVMKAGQIASYMPGSLPPGAQRVLAELQASSTPMAFHRIDEQLVAELGAPARDLFESIDERPFAAASIGQVHRAVHAGAPVAVKVQYPGVEDAIRSDLKMVSVIARLSMVGGASDPGALTAELRERLLEECDYRREADNQRLFAELLATIPGAHTPDVIGERSAQRVLTSAFVDGALLSAPLEQAARDRAGAIIFRACFELLFRRCIYNADPHPGNYLLGPTGDVTFLDFGCTRRFDSEMIATWKRMARALIDGDRVVFAECFRALGFLGKEKGFDWDYQWDALRFLYRPFLEPGFRVEAEWVQKSFGILMFDNPNRFKIAMPPAWLFLNRLQWGLNAVLAQLNATGPWREIIDELIAAKADPA